MTIAEITQKTTAQPLNQFFKNRSVDRYFLELLQFFGIHPNARFNKLAVVHAVDETGGRLKVERALTQLIDEGIVKTNIENNTRFYLLTEDEPMRRLVLDLAGLDWYQKHTVFVNIQTEPKIIIPSNCLVGN